MHGNHGLRVDGEKLKPRLIEDLTVCHFPIRSVDQFTSKCVIMYLRYVARFGAMGEYAFQYRNMLALIDGSRSNLAKEMERTSKIYGLPSGYKMAGRATVRPLRYLGGPLKYTLPASKALANIVRHAEKLAQQISVLEQAHSQSGE